MAIMGTLNESIGCGGTPRTVVSTSGRRKETKRTERCRLCVRGTVRCDEMINVVKMEINKLDGDLCDEKATTVSPSTSPATTSAV